MPQLITQNLRRCFRCNDIKPLNKDNFWSSKTSAGGFRYDCLGCLRSPLRTFNCYVCNTEIVDADPRRKYCSKVCKNRIYNPRSNRIKNRRLKIRFLVLQRCGFACAYCGRKPPEVQLQIDHITPKSKGGSDNLLNYTTACAECNLGKRDMFL